MGEFPRVADQLLPDNAASQANNCRFLAGNLESWMSYNSVVGIVKSGTIKTIYLMDDQYWLHWRQAELTGTQVTVDVARSPIADDERTIFTGTDRPRQTNITLATNGLAPPQAYPINSFWLGVPAPELAPTLSLSNDETEPGEVNLENLAATENSTANWGPFSGDVPDFQVFDNTSLPGIDPYPGSNYFFGGPLVGAGAGDTTIAPYSFVLADKGVSPGQSWTLNWQQASGTNASKLMVEMVWYPEIGAEIERTSGTLEAITPANTWVARSINGLIPAGAHHADILLTFENVGGGATDAYIDEATLTVANASVSYTGNSLDDFTIATAGGGTVVVDNTFGYPAPSFRFDGEDGRFATIYRNYLVDTATSYTMDFDLRLDGSDNNDARFGIILGATSAGAGNGFRISDDRIQILSTSGWVSAASIGETLVVYNDNDTKLHVNIVVEKSGSAEVSATMTVTRIADNLVLWTGSRNMLVAGGYLGWQFEGDGGSTDHAWMDNLTISFIYATSAPTESATFTQYVYTYVNPLGEEGPPSPLSRLVQFPNDGSVTVTMDTTGPDDPEYGITNPTPAAYAPVKSKKRIYRAVTAGGVTSFLFVAEVDLDVATYEDSLDDDQLGEELETVDWDLPPSDGFGVIALPNGVTMMASGSELAPSVVNHSHAYPQAYRLKFASDIVAIAAIDTSVIVGTNTYPYLVVGSDPSQMSAAKFEQRQACVSKESMVSIKGFGIVYASPDGLVAINATGNLQLVTEQFFSRKEWQAINPSSMISMVHDDRYFGFTDTGYGFMFDPAKQGNGWTQITANALCGFSDPVTDILYYVQGGEIRAWDSHPTDKLTFAWTSKIFQLPRDADFVCCQIKADDYTNLELRLFCDGVQVTWPDTGLNYRVVSNEKEFVLPVKKYRYFQIKLNGTGIIKNVEIAEDMEELS